MLIWISETPCLSHEWYFIECGYFSFWAENQEIPYHNRGKFRKNAVYCVRNFIVFSVNFSKQQILYRKSAIPVGCRIRSCSRRRMLFLYTSFRLFIRHTGCLYKMRNCFEKNADFETGEGLQPLFFVHVNFQTSGTTEQSNTETEKTPKQRKHPEQSDLCIFYAKYASRTRKYFTPYFPAKQNRARDSSKCHALRIARLAPG